MGKALGQAKHGKVGMRGGVRLNGRMGKPAYCAQRGTSALYSLSACSPAPQAQSNMDVCKSVLEPI